MWEKWPIRFDVFKNFVFLSIPLTQQLFNNGDWLKIIKFSTLLMITEVIYLVIKLTKYIQSTS